MSTREPERVEVMGRVVKKGLNLIDAAAMLQLPPDQTLVAMLSAEG